MARSNAPVSSFGPELMTVLKDGANARRDYDFPDPQTAFRFMSRINALRAAMRREKHPDSDRVYRAGVKIPRDNKCRVVVAPRDSEFGDFLKSAGTPILHEDPPDPSPRETPHPGTAPDSADSFLSSLTSKKDEEPLK